MNLYWISIALTFSGLFMWWFGNNQTLGFAIFMAGGIVWFIEQRIEALEKRANKKEGPEPENDKPKES
jgi:hypothetical protein